MNYAGILYKQMERSGDTNGCTVIALAQILKLSYQDANKIAMSRYNRPFRRGMYTSELVKMYSEELRKQGKQLIKLDKSEILKKVNTGSYNVKTLTSNNIKRAKLRGTHVLITNSHVSVIKGGKVTDFTTNEASHVKHIYKIIKKSVDN